MKLVLVAALFAGNVLADTAALPAPSAVSRRTGKTAKSWRPVRWLKRVKDREADFAEKFSGWGIRNPHPGAAE